MREEDLKQTGGCCKRTAMFTKYALQDVARNKCHFMLAFGSVFVVVFSILVVNTIIQMGPLVFLSLGQKTEGQIDAIFTPSSPGIMNNNQYLYYWNEG